MLHALCVAWFARCGGDPAATPVVGLAGPRWPTVADCHRVAPCGSRVSARGHAAMAGRVGLQLVVRPAGASPVHGGQSSGGRCHAAATERALVEAVPPEIYNDRISAMRVRSLPAPTDRCARCPVLPVAKQIRRISRRMVPGGRDVGDVLTLAQHPIRGREFAHDLLGEGGADADDGSAVEHLVGDALVVHPRPLL
jgi:hypothetical protein